MTPNEKGPQDKSPAALRKNGSVVDYKTGAQANASSRQRQFTQSCRFMESIIEIVNSQLE
jgi:hypothetical protein